MEVFLISGKSGHGKDTIAKYIEEKCKKQNKNVLIIHFGDAVKWFAREFFKWDGEKNEYGRTLLQTIGTERLRKNFPTYWADIVAKFLAAIPLWDVVLIPDWRFINEFETVDKYVNNVHTIRVERYENGELYVNKKMTNEQLNHISECELDNFNAFEWIIEHKNIEEMQQSADYILEYFKIL